MKYCWTTTIAFRRITSHVVHVILLKAIVVVQQYFMLFTRNYYTSAITYYTVNLELIARLMPECDFSSV